MDPVTLTALMQVAPYALNFIQGLFNKPPEPTPMPEQMSYGDAFAQAAGMVNPVYDKYWQQQQQALNQDFINRGFFGQAPAAQIMANAANENAGMRAAETGNLAMQIQQGTNQQNMQRWQLINDYAMQQANQQMMNRSAMLQAGAGMAGAVGNAAEYGLARRQQDWNDQFNTRELYGGWWYGNNMPNRNPNSLNKNMLSGLPDQLNSPSYSQETLAALPGVAKQSAANIPSLNTNPMAQPQSFNLYR
jgi:hypothetical protein